MARAVLVAALLLASVARADLENPIPPPLLADTCTLIDGALTVYISDSGCDRTEAGAEVYVPTAMSFRRLTCQASADPGTGRTITITGRTGTCGSSSDTAFACTLTGGAGRPTCSNTTNVLQVGAQKCWSLKVAPSGVFLTSVGVRCWLERSS